ncbi:MAG: hypothetical protein VYE73_17995 [Acidobacteriota bacterium]|nr:hypothetical protein [Acidobacteriota bacterium]
MDSLSDSAQSNVSRVMEIFTSSRERFVTYDIPLSPAGASFVEAVRSLDAVQAREREAAAESVPFIDDLVPADRSPLVLG